jgi:hypothetical protein
MATIINNYNGTALVTVDDGTLNTTASTLRFPGRGYVNYGEPVNENLVWIMQHFARNIPPTNPINGQAWYDTTNKLLKIYDSGTSSWIMAGSVFYGSAAPTITSTNNIPLWFNTLKKQLFSYDTALSAWILVGPIGAANGLNPSFGPASYTTLDAVLISDGTSDHPVFRFALGSTTTAILSLDQQFTPNPAISGFSTIKPGLNFSSSISNVTVSGDQFAFRRDQTNLPLTDNTLNLGSSGLRFANIYGVNLVGTATTAKYADLAEKYSADADYEPGTVVCIGGSAEITSTTVLGDENVLGVVSTNPGFLMNTDLKVAFPTEVAMTGRVPCKVVGPVKKGQRLMSSGVNGTACAWDDVFGTLSVIGRSLVEKHSTEVEKIEIIVGKN